MSNMQKLEDMLALERLDVFTVIDGEEIKTEIFFASSDDKQEAKLMLQEAFSSGAKRISMAALNGIYHCFNLDRIDYLKVR